MDDGQRITISPTELREMVRDAAKEATALTELFGECESPVEESFFEALVASADDWSVVFHRDGSVQCVRLSIGTRTMLVFPQALLRPYRVDFLLFETETNGAFMVVEIDGHDFHDRTKAQASRDRERDRRLLSRGVSTVRFTGSDVHRDADACARDAINLCLGISTCLAE